MLAKFFYHPVQKSTDESGLPHYEDVVYVTINRDATHSMTRAATEEDMERFAPFYSAFVKATAPYEKLEGFPLEMWPVASPSDVANLKIRGIRTVQELAKMPSTGLPPHAVELSRKAKNFIKMAGASNKMTEEAEKILAENEQLKESVSFLKAQVAKLEAQVAKSGVDA